MFFLVVEDEPAVQRAIARALRPFGEARFAATVVDADAIVEANRSSLTGAVIDLHLDDGSGMAVIARLRARHPALPVMLLSGRAERDDINEAQLHGVEVVIKGSDRVTRCIERFGLRATTASRIGDRRLRAIVERVAERAELSPGQVAVLSARVGGASAASTAHTLGLSERATRALVERTLAKTRHDRMDDLVTEILREALSA